MKKIALFSLMCCLCGVYAVPAFAGSCEIRSLTASEDEEGDEYLYISKNHQDIQKAFACETEGNSKNCSDGTKVLVSGEQQYIGDRFATNGTDVYECRTTGSFTLSNDYWKSVGTSTLPKCKATKGYKEFSKMDAHNVIYCAEVVEIEGNRKYCVGKNKDDICIGRDDCENCDNNLNPVKKQCTSTLDGKMFDIGQSDTFDCNKYPGVDPNRQPYLTGKVCYRTCLEKTNGDVEILQSIKECIDNTYAHIDFSGSEKSRYKTAIPGFKKCEKKSESVKPGFCDKYKQWDKRYACCLAGKDTEWKGKDLSNDGTCVCKDGSKWEYNEKTKRGKCVANETPVPPAAEENCTYSFSATIECKGVTKPVNKTRVLTKDELAGAKTCEEFKELYGADLKKAKELFGDLCDDNAESETPVVTPEPASSGPSKPEINSAQSTLKGFFDYAKKNASVWRTSEGNFNGARLASDITAGVVLGTVGGVVSGVVIKKNQVKKGFEALHCTVGGQKVAEWGDEFSVGLRR